MLININFFDRRHKCILNIEIQKILYKLQLPAEKISVFYVAEYCLLSKANAQVTANLVDSRIEVKHLSETTHRLFNVPVKVMAIKYLFSFVYTKVKLK